MRRLLATCLALALISSTAEAGRGGFGGMSGRGAGRQPSIGQSFSRMGSGGGTNSGLPTRSFSTMNQRSATGGSSFRRSGGSPQFESRRINQSFRNLDSSSAKKPYSDGMFNRGKEPKTNSGIRTFDLLERGSLGKVRPDRPGNSLLSETLGNKSRISEVVRGSSSSHRLTESPKLGEIGRGQSSAGKVRDISNRIGSAGGGLGLKFGSIDSSRINRLISGNTARQLDLEGQFKLRDKGDLVRHLDLGKKLADRGGWMNRFCGPVNKDYSKHCIASSYCGPSWYPSRCYYPRWCHWVDWCWTPTYVYDPRPAYCRPVVCQPCPGWEVYEYPVWEPLPVVACGTWVDVVPVSVGSAVDVQLLAVRLVDNGHPEQQLGPRYRVWVRNNSEIAIAQPFNVLAMAAPDDKPAEGLPQAGVEIESIEAGQTLAVDVRLPFAANESGVDSQTRLLKLHVLVDSHRDLNEEIEGNNGVVLARREILPVDPSVFSSEATETKAGEVISLAGEGLGPEAGQVLVRVGGLELQGEIQGWYDLGARVKLPELPLASDTDAELVIVRGDGAATNPIDIKLATAEAKGASAASAAN